ncbi:hypothetical protein DM01DRAFT_1408398 [Hesseltinella vesiculosa]|uniref:SH3 domain-containing protein n=1 Tax=Hesseltinella vesiculosa TaxID=101127 RepID=A0A1X2GEE3_9FUNG|nr:hypothetical protein DM01DRAFT_1408398 [Hesseltinella vesiculosa]
MLFSNVYLIALYGFNLIGWVISFVGLCASDGHTLSHSWWVVIYNAAVLVIIAGTLWKKATGLLSPLILSLVTVGIVYSTEEVAYYLEHDRRSAFFVTGSGGIICIFANFMWLTVFGIQLPITGDGMPLCMNRSEKPNDDTPSKIEDLEVEQHTVYVTPHTDFEIPVVALHAYGANPDDPNELSFEKGEVLYVHEKRGSWWQAKKTNGAVGMIPSNYVNDMPPAQ